MNKSIFYVQLSNKNTYIHNIVSSYIRFDDVNYIYNFKVICVYIPFTNANDIFFMDRFCNDGL